MLPGARVEAFIGVTDLGRARAFYEGALGLRVVGSDGFALVLDGGGTTIRVQQLETPPALPQTVLGWVVPDIAAAVDELRGNGMAFTPTATCSRCINLAEVGAAPRTDPRPARVTEQVEWV